jgi:hypothetical protein
VTVTPPSRTPSGELTGRGATSRLLNALNALNAVDLPAPGSLFVQTASKLLTSLRPGDEITADVEVLPAERSPATPNQGR